MILKFNVKEQTISLVNTKSVPRIGSKDYLVLQFSFSSDWENLNKLVYLQNGDVSQPIDIVDNLVEVPEWFTEQNSFNVTLFGTDGTTEVPTNVVSVQLEKSNDLWVKDAPEPQPSWLVSVLDAAELVKEATVHGPTIGSNGNWYTWGFESKQYIDTGVAASGGSGEGGTTDHTKLTNRDADDQHPMSAITGLAGALAGKVSVADIINDLATNAANKPLSAAQGVALKALIDAISIPEKLPNPNALTFTGAVEGSYDGSEAKTINIPSGGEKEWKCLRSFTLPEDPSSDTSGITWTMCRAEGYTDQIATFEFSTDENGNNFSVREVFLIMNMAYGINQNYFGLSDQNGNLGYGNLFANRSILGNKSSLTHMALYVRSIGTHVQGVLTTEDNYTGPMAGQGPNRNQAREDEDITKLKFGTFYDNSILPGSSFEFWGR